MNKKFFLCLILSLILLASGCASNTTTTNQGPTISNVNIPSVVPTNTYHILSATTDSEASLEYKVTEGQIETDYGNEVEWKAPSQESKFKVSIIADQNGKITTVSETVEVKQAKLETTKDKFDVDIGKDNYPVNIKLESNTDNIKVLDLALIAWGSDNKPILSQNINNKYIATKKTSNLDYNSTSKQYSISLLTENYFEEVPEKVHAYITRIEYNSGEIWSLE